MKNFYDEHLMQFGSGQIIDERFEIISNPVKRSFGIAYLVFDQQSNEKKILLFVPDSISNDAEAMANIRDEAGMIRWLNHPHIARLYEFHSTGRYHYFELEYVKGKNLRQKKVTSEEKRLSENIVKWLAIQILEALEYAHNNNVIHRDLKPQNVVLTPDGKVKLIDFGISETLRESTSLVWDTIPQTTVLYMAPEQLLGKQISIASDIYSLAAIMYDLLSGKPPFFSGDVYNQILKEEPAPISHIKPELNAIILKALAKDPLDRFQQCREMKSGLEKIQTPVAPRKKQPASEPEQEQPLPLEQKKEKKKKNKLRFRFFSLNPTLKYMTGSLIVVFLASMLVSKLPVYLEQIGKGKNQKIESEQEAFKLKIISAFRQEADAKFKMRFFVSPPGNNALELFQKVLKLNPGDSLALKRIEQIKFIFLNDAKSAMDKGRYQEAASILNDGLFYFPTDSLLLQLKKDPAITQFGKIRIIILNGAGVKGIAKQLAIYLTKQNYTVIKTDNYKIKGRFFWKVPKSRLVGSRSKQNQVIELEKLLNIPYEWTESDQPGSETILLILGKDYRKLPPFKG